MASQSCRGRPSQKIKIRHSNNFKAIRIKISLHINMVFMAHRVMLKELKNEKEVVTMTLFVQRKE